MSISENIDTDENIPRWKLELKKLLLILLESKNTNKKNRTKKNLTSICECKYS